jgi:hypothetical protein
MVTGADVLTRSSALYENDYSILNFLTQNASILSAVGRFLSPVINTTVRMWQFNRFYHDMNIAWFSAIHHIGC